MRKKDCNISILVNFIAKKGKKFCRAIHGSESLFQSFSLIGTPTQIGCAIDNNSNPWIVPPFQHISGSNYCTFFAQAV